MQTMNINLNVKTDKFQTLQSPTLCSIFKKRYHIEYKNEVNTWLVKGIKLSIAHFQYLLRRAEDGHCLFGGWARMAQPIHSFNIVEVSEISGDFSGLSLFYVLYVIVSNIGSFKVDQLIWMVSG